MDMNYVKSVFYKLSSRNLTFFYEVRTNLSRENVKILSEAGVNDVQPGIESLSNHVLKLMRKGTTALKNIQVLKWFKEHGISAGWNFLYGFPGETREDYNSIIETLHSIRFLEPPKGCGTIRLDRFSPYFNNPKKFGLTNVRPTRSYKYIYPFPDEYLRNIAYYFEYDYKTGMDPTGYANEAIKLVKDWQDKPEKGTLKSISLDDSRLFLNDTRSCATRPYFVLSGIDRQVYDYCDCSRSCRAVLKHLNSISNRSFHLNQVRNYLDALVANRLMVTDGKSYLSLAIRSGSKSK
jgi:ribosomal peptide maturation radical SAM protein 1